MVILGLGANTGYPLDTFRQAIHELNRTELSVCAVSPVYKSDALLLPDSPDAWNKSYLNVALACETQLTPREVVQRTKQIEMHLGRQSTQRFAPRPIDIDILAWHNQVIVQDGLQIPHAELHKRPFALWPLLDLLPHWRHPQRDISEVLNSWGSRFSQQAPLKTYQILQRIDAPVLVGILNITPDSFSDGGQFNTPDQALEQSKKLFAEGAEIIDIGAESTRPGAIPVSPQVEWQLLEPVLNVLDAYWKNKSFKPKISIDTRHYATAEKAIAMMEVDWINDVSGLSDPKMQAVVLASKINCVFMHNLGVPAEKNVTLPLDKSATLQVLQWAKQRLSLCMDYGISPEQLIFDVGIGFGKTAHQSLELLKHMTWFHELNVRLLVGHSRKSFLNIFSETPAAERDFETAIFSYYLASQGVNYLRVHDAGAQSKALKIFANLNSARESY